MLPAVGTCRDFSLYSVDKFRAYKSVVLIYNTDIIPSTAISSFDRIAHIDEIVLCKIRIFLDGRVLLARPGTDIELGSVDHAYPLRSLAELYCSLCRFLICCCAIVDPYITVDRGVSEFVFLVAACSTVGYDTWYTGSVAFVGVDIGAIEAVDGSDV